jgi:hypothetical protein
MAKKNSASDTFKPNNNPAKVKIAKEVLTNVNILTGIDMHSEAANILRAEEARLAEVNRVLATHGFDIFAHSSQVDLIKEGKISCGKFLISKNNLNAELLHDDTIGIWLWLIKDPEVTKIIVSRAGKSRRQYVVPDLNQNFRVLQARSNGMTDDSYLYNIIDWKKRKRNEGHFDGTKGFFIGKTSLQLHLGSNVTAIQIEVLQDSEGSPILFFYERRTDNSSIAFGYCSARPIGLTSSPGVAIEALDNACSKPSPPYGDE